MDREVFQSNKMIAFITVIVIFIGVTIAYLKADFPIEMFAVASIFGVLFLLPALKTKLIIEDGMLRYEKRGGKEEVELAKVSQILAREVETIVNKDNEPSSFQSSGSRIKFSNNLNQERQVQKVIYILDGAGRTILSVPANLVGFTQRIRFKEAIHAVNPNIEVF